MSLKTPKTGLASLMREWMSMQRKPFTVGMIAGALSIPPGASCDHIHNAVRDFARRAEIFPAASSLRRTKSGHPGPMQTFYAYNPGWHRVHKGTLNKRIYKAMYVSGTFTLSEIQRLSEAPDRSWLDKVTRPLRKDDLIRPVGRRLCAHGSGTETVYYIPDRDRFRLEVMK